MIEYWTDKSSNRPSKQQFNIFLTNFSFLYRSIFLYSAQILVLTELSKNYHQ